ncbi:MAG: DUF72 domain-containing protein, partial [Catalinimonas sp.]
MKFGKLEDLRGVDFTLPPDPPGGTFPRATAPPRTFLGCPVWHNRAWVPRFYPPTTREADFLHAYVRRFNTIELNVTHYQIPTERTVQRWRAAAEGAEHPFYYCPKWPRAVSHEKQLVGTTGEVEAFCAALRGLGPALGPSFLQLPPQFGPERRGVLEGFLDQLPDGVPLTVEFRNPAWFGRNTSGFDLLRERGVGTVLSDVAGRRDALHMRLTTPTVFVRFVGNDLHPTDFTRLDAWVQRLRAWRECGA